MATTQEHMQKTGGKTQARQRLTLPEEWKVANDCQMPVFPGCYLVDPYEGKIYIKTKDEVLMVAQSGTDIPKEFESMV